MWAEENGERSVTPLTNTHTHTVHAVHNTRNIQCYIDSMLAHTGILTCSHNAHNTIPKHAFYRYIKCAALEKSEYTKSVVADQQVNGVRKTNSTASM